MHHDWVSSHGLILQSILQNEKLGKTQHRVNSTSIRQGWRTPWKWSQLLQKNLLFQNKMFVFRGKIKYLCTLTYLKCDLRRLLSCCFFCWYDEILPSHSEHVSLFLLLHMSQMNNHSSDAEEEIWGRKTRRCGGHELSAKHWGRELQLSKFYLYYRLYYISKNQDVHSCLCFCDYSRK